MFQHASIPVDRKMRAIFCSLVGGETGLQSSAGGPSQAKWPEPAVSPPCPLPVCPAKTKVTGAKRCLSSLLSLTSAQLSLPVAFISTSNHNDTTPTKNSTQPCLVHHLNSPPKSTTGAFPGLIVTLLLACTLNPHICPTSTRKTNTELSSIVAAV